MREPATAPEQRPERGRDQTMISAQRAPARMPLTRLPRVGWPGALGDSARGGCGMRPQDILRAGVEKADVGVVGTLKVRYEAR
jgi:hypothetical protein